MVRRQLANLRAAFMLVLARASYLALAAALALAAFLLAVWFPNFGLIGDVFGAAAPLAAKIRLALSLLGGIDTNFSLFSAAYTIAIAILFGVNTAMIAYLLRHKRAASAGGNIALGSGAVASGVLGIGCAACGSLVSGALFSALGATGALAVLPLKGGEFGLLSVALLLLSLLLISRTLAQPVACPLPAGQALPQRSTTETLRT